MRVMQRWMPRTLFGRSALMIAGVVLAAQLATSWVYYQWVQRPRLDFVSDLVMAYVDQTRDALSNMSAQQRAAFLQRTDQPRELRVSREPPPAQDTGVVLQPALQLLLQGVQQRLRPGESLLMQFKPERALWVSVVTPAGERFWVAVVLQRLRIDNAVGLLLPFVSITVFAILGGLWLHRSINRPLRELHAAASSVGRGDKPQQLSLAGPTEVVQLQSAFNRMVGDLNRADADRRLMLAGVSHDLRTPVTRLRLALELMQPSPAHDQLGRMQANLDEVDAALTQFLDFARDERDEPLINADLRDIARECVAQFEARDEVHVVARGGLIGLDLADTAVVVPCRPQALTRALRNLVDNALKYSHGQVEVIVQAPQAGQGAVLIVRDIGEPLQDADLARLRQPFTRRQEARSGGPAGTGLGLAIVERIAALHQAQLDLIARPDGGLEARLTFTPPFTP